MLRFFAKKRHPLGLVLSGFAVIAFWRGIWGLMDMYLFPQWPLASYGVSLVVGLAILYFNDFSFSEFE